jgi:hypothetical protein
MTDVEPGSALYVCDLDGTLLRSDATLSGFARDGINRLLDAGVHLTLASARGTAGMRALLDGVRLRLPVIELNGAFVSDMRSAARRQQRPLGVGRVRRSRDDPLDRGGPGPLDLGRQPGPGPLRRPRQRLDQLVRGGEEETPRPEAGALRRSPRGRRRRGGGADHHVRAGSGGRCADRPPPPCNRPRSEGPRRRQRVLAGLDRNHGLAPRGGEGGCGPGPARRLHHTTRQPKRSSSL